MIHELLTVFCIVYVYLGLIYAVADMYQYRASWRDMQCQKLLVVWMCLWAAVFILMLVLWPTITITEKVIRAKNS